MKLMSQFHQSNFAHRVLELHPEEGLVTMGDFTRCTKCGAVKFAFPGTSWRSTK